ncbi:MAG: hypothetical protein C0608_04680 [Deltaproteobacteria bacterium]|nr:MAG: hypothetical protein C0608_04680 [Deltaproteobacteria bacterium]
MKEQKVSILICDDDVLLLRELKEIAQGAGYNATTAHDGAEALSLMSENTFDLVITDLMMPRIDGPTLMARINELPRTPPKVIAITSYATLDSAVTCLRRGAADFLAKPFTMEEFTETVMRVLSTEVPLHHSPDWGDIQDKFSLTMRQVEILKAFYLTGKSNAELAEELFVTVHTIKSHLKSAYMKMGVSSRAELLRLLRDHSPLNTP